jgi:hypothetical protein
MGKAKLFCAPAVFYSYEEKFGKPVPTVFYRYAKNHRKLAVFSSVVSWGGR